MFRYPSKALLNFSISTVRRRHASTVNSMAQSMHVFDRKLKQQQKDSAATANVTLSRKVDYVRNEIAARLTDRLFDIKREFAVGLDLGCGAGHISPLLTSDKVNLLYSCDLSRGMLTRDIGRTDNRDPDLDGPPTPVIRVQADEEFLPFQANSFDLIMSSLSLHWTNDLASCFAQIQETLKDDGVFLGAMFGGETLYQLRCSLQVAELERLGGFSSHTSPFVDVRDIGGLLNGAGMNLTTIDVDYVTVHYPTMFELLDDLKLMGENNATWTRASFLHRDTLMAASSIYDAEYGVNQEDGSRCIPATFHIVFFIGWKPHGSQPKPLRRGSATSSLKDLDQLVLTAKQ